MRRVQTVGTLYGLMQTWPTSPQAPQVGNLVPHHIGFDVTTPSGSIFQSAILYPSWQTFHPFYMDTGENSAHMSSRRNAPGSRLGCQQACGGC